MQSVFTHSNVLIHSYNTFVLSLAPYSDMPEEREPKGENAPNDCHKKSSTKYALLTIQHVVTVFC